MLELIDIQPDLQIQESEYKRLLGFPVAHVLEGRSRELAHWARQWYAENGKPWIYARQMDGVGLADEKLHVNGSHFSSKHLHDQFNVAQVHGLMLVAVSAGKQCEEKARELWEEGKPDEYFFMEVYGSVVVEHLVALANGRICGWADQNGMVALPHYSPGYSGWDVTDQNPLWDLIHEGKNGSFPGALEVLESGMLRPKKSLLAVIGLTRHRDKTQVSRRLIPCENCSLPACQYRRGAYQYSPPQIEDVRRLQSTRIESPAISPSGLDHDARYTVKPKALHKWSQERLQWKLLHDGSIEARFRYEGTTCSNMGRALEYDYHIILSPSHEGHKIREAICVPAPGDTGHAYQCEYLKDADAFKRAVHDEKPLRGQSLNDVFSWERVFSPSGCYCDAERRNHKWGLVFEVLHYALVQREKETNGQAPIIKS